MCYLLRRGPSDTRPYGTHMMCNTYLSVSSTCTLYVWTPCDLDPISTGESCVRRQLNKPFESGQAVCTATPNSVFHTDMKSIFLLGLPHSVLVVKKPDIPFSSICVQD